jgi:G3E family GTPase
LKLGVLVNEVASLDVDSQLLHTQQSNAAAGIKAARLAGGCACCAVAGDLEAALAELANSPSYQQLDYLVSVMTSCNQIN